MAGIPIYDLSARNMGAGADVLANLGQSFMASYDAGKKRSLEDQQRKAQDEQVAIQLGSLIPGAGSPPTAMPAPQNVEAQSVPTFARIDVPPSAKFGDLFKKYGEANGIDPGYLARTAQIESGMNPNAKNPSSSAGGLFQFIDSTAKQYGLANKADPEQATAAAARLAADNKAILSRALGREPTAGELYLAHQQGAGGAAKILSNPNARAVDVVGQQAVALNGGDASMTAGQFASKWTSKFGGQGDQPQTQMAQASGIASPRGVVSDAAVQMMKSANPYTRAAGLKMVQEAGNKGNLTYQSRPDGSIVALDPSGRIAPQIVMQGTNNPLDEQSKMLGNERTRLEIQKQQRDLQGEGATPLSPDERKSLGIPDGQPAYKTRSGDVKFGPAGTKIINEAQKVETEEAKLRAKSSADYLGDLAKEAGSNSQRNSDITALDGLLNQGWTGRGADQVAKLDAIAKSIGLSAGSLASRSQAIEAIVNRVAPTLRIAGSGTTSDRDLQTFMQSLPRLSNTPEGNKLIIETLRAATNAAAEKSNIARMWQSGKLSPSEASERIAEIDNRGIMPKAKDTPQQQPAQQIREGSTATNPRTGERIIYRSGKWGAM